MDKPDQYSQQYDEVSLVDLATILVRRRWIFYSVFGGVILLAVLYALFMVGEEREYNTLVQLAEQKQGKNMEPFQPVATVLATIHNRWYPELQSNYAEVEGRKLPFQIEVSNPDDTSLIKLTSLTSPDLSDEVQTLHQQLIDKLIQRQSFLLESRKQTLEKRLNSVDQYLDQISGEEAAAMIQNRMDLIAQLESLQPAETLVVARQSLDQKGTSKKLILALAVVLGFILGMFAAFVAEFVAHVRSSLRENSIAD